MDSWEPRYKFQTGVGFIALRKMAQMIKRLNGKMQYARIDRHLKFTGSRGSKF